MATKKYTTKQDFLKNIKSLLPENIPIGTQTGWRKYINGYVHYVSGHMENDPELNVAVVKFNSDGNLAGEEFRENGHRHNSNGAAVIEYSSTGTVLKEEYFLKGIEYSFKDYQTKQKEIKPSYLTFGTRKIRIKELKEKLGNFIKEDSNGNILNIKELTKDNFNLDKYGDSDGTINYNSLDKDTIYINNTILFTNNYDITKPTSWVITIEGDLTAPRYFIDNSTPVIDWSQQIFKTTSSGVPFWLQKKEFGSLGISESTKIPEFSSIEQLKPILNDFLSPFNKQTNVAYVYQDNFFYVIKDAKTNVVYEKRVPLRPNLIKNDTEIDMGWEKELTAFQKAGYVAGMTSRPVPISKEEFFAAKQQIQAAIQPSPLVNSGSLIQQTEVSSTKDNLTPKFFLDKLSEDLKKKGFEPKFVTTKNGDVEIQIVPIVAATNITPIVQVGSGSLTPFMQDFYKTPNLVSGSAVTPYNLMEYKTLNKTEELKYQLIAPEMLAYLFGSGSAKPTNPVSEEKESKFVKTVKSDAKEVAKRIATQQVSSFIHNLLIDFLTKKQNKAKSEIEKFLASEKGKVVLSMTIGSILPLMTDYFPEKYREVLKEISSEFRLQAETEIALGFTDSVIAPFVSQLGTSLSTFELFSGINTERVRVQVSEGLTEPTGEAIESEESIFSSEVSSNQKTLN